MEKHDKVEPHTVAQPEIHTSKFVVEVLGKVHKAIDGLDKFAVQVTQGSALYAFRKTVTASEGAHLPMPVLNRVGNLQGMVISRRAHTLYKLSFSIAKKLADYDKALLVAGIVIELAKDADRFSAIHESKASKSEKGRLYVLTGSTAVLRGLTGVVPAAAHIIALSLEGYCGAASIAGVGGAKAWARNLRDADAKVTAIHSVIMTPEFMQGLGNQTVNFLETHIHLN